MPAASDSSAVSVGVGAVTPDVVARVGACVAWGGELVNSCLKVTGFTAADGVPLDDNFGGNKEDKT